MDAPTRKLFIKTFGCQMNVHDSLRMEEVLAAEGFGLTADPGEADLILVNTCTVREKSRQKALSAVGRYAQLKARRPGMLLGIAGCVAQQDGDALLELAPALDLVLSPDYIADLPEILVRARTTPAVQVGFADVEQYSFLQASPLPGREEVTSLVTIQKGCDNACSYCIVPRVRGPEVSRPVDQVLEDVQRRLERGVREVTLIGQNVNAYRGVDQTDEDFVTLLRLVDQLKDQGLRRVRFTTSHPRDFSPALARAFGELSTLCPWLHLPVQSGSDRVLELMNRGYGRQDYQRGIAQVRQACPDVALGTDIIVGFPGETESDFLDTVSLIEEIQHDYLYSFMYCVREGSPAAATLDPIPLEEKRSRLRHLQGVQDVITRQRLGALRGQQVEVLVEGPSRRGLPQLSGRDPGNRVVNLDRGEDAPQWQQLVGQVIEVEITHAGAHSLTGIPAGRVARGGAP